MNKASEYRQHARECRALALQMDMPERRSQVLEMAERWERLAADRQALVEKYPDLADDEAEAEAASVPRAEGQAGARPPTHTPGRAGQ